MLTSEGCEYQLVDHNHSNHAPYNHNNPHHRVVKVRGGELGWGDKEREREKEGEGKEKEKEESRNKLNIRRGGDGSVMGSYWKMTRKTGRRLQCFTRLKYAI